MRAPNMKKGAKNLLSDFMLKDPRVRQQQSANSLIEFFKAIATKRKRKKVSGE